MYRSFTFLTIIGTFFSVSALNVLAHRSRHTLCYLSIFVEPEVQRATGECMIFPTGRYHVSQARRKQKLKTGTCRYCISYGHDGY